MSRLTKCCGLLLALCLTGCASLVSGRYQSVHITSVPEYAAVSIDGTMSGYTPTTAQLKRRDRHHIVLSKTGYLDEMLWTTQGYNWWNMGNVLFGGVVGIVIDMASGAVYTVQPKEIAAALTPLPPQATQPQEPPTPAAHAPTASPPLATTGSAPVTTMASTPSVPALPIVEERKPVSSQPATRRSYTDPKTGVTYTPAE